MTLTASPGASLPSTTLPAAMARGGSATRCRNQSCIHIPVHVHQVLWTFSIYLEAVAILPQLVLLQRTNNIDNLTGNYVFLLG